MAWTEYLKPTDNTSFEEAGIQEQTGEQLGVQWLTPDGKVWAVPTTHDAFAKDYLGGVDAAFSAGCVRVHFDAGILNIQAKDAQAFDLPALELMANNPQVLGIAAESYPLGKYAGFSSKAFKDSFSTLSNYVAKAWYQAGRFGFSFLQLFADAIDNSKVIEEPLTVEHLTITFNEALFDYYLSAPNMEPGWYITEIGGMKVGFGSKYQLKKFLLKIKEEFFSDGNIPGSNIRIAPIPQISAPIVRRMGSVPIIENNIPLEVKKKLEQGSVGPQLWEISSGEEDSSKILNNRPTGPII